MPKQKSALKDNIKKWIQNKSEFKMSNEIEVFCKVCGKIVSRYKHFVI